MLAGEPPETSEYIRTYPLKQFALPSPQCQSLFVSFGAQISTRNIPENRVGVLLFKELLHDKPRRIPYQKLTASFCRYPLDSYAYVSSILAELKVNLLDYIRIMISPMG